MREGRVAARPAGQAQVADVGRQAGLQRDVRGDRAGDLHSAEAGRGGGLDRLQEVGPRPAIVAAVAEEEEREGDREK